jgi:hypothetical protein
MRLERTATESGSVHDGGMKTIMKLEDLTTIDQLDAFLTGTQAVAFSVISDKDACYRWIQGELVKFRYLSLSRQGKGIVIGYLMKICQQQRTLTAFCQFRLSGFHQFSVSSISRLVSAVSSCGGVIPGMRPASALKPCSPSGGIRFLKAEL